MLGKCCPDIFFFGDNTIITQCFPVAVKVIEHMAAVRIAKEAPFFINAEVETDKPPAGDKLFSTRKQDTF